MYESRLIRIGDESGVGEARRVAARLARDLGFDAGAAGRLAIVVNELANNVWQHAHGGELLLRPLEDGVEVLALDKGRGIADVGRALGDGYSTAGTAGTGLGAARRQSQAFEIYSGEGRGTAAVARVLRDEHAAMPPADFGAVCVAKPGEAVSGDGWAVERDADRTLLVVVDGLGHGPDAAAAARAAILAFQRLANRMPPEIIALMHDALRETRGAAVAVALIDRAAETVRWSALGNVAGYVVRGEQSSGLISAHGTAGAEVRKPSDQRESLRAGDTLVVATDGVRPRWQWPAYPGLATRDPALVAGVLYRDFANGRDDATVVVMRQAVA